MSLPSCRNYRNNQLRNRLRLLLLLLLLVLAQPLVLCALVFALPLQLVGFFLSDPPDRPFSNQMRASKRGMHI